MCTSCFISVKTRLIFANPSERVVIFCLAGSELGPGCLFAESVERYSRKAGGDPRAYTSDALSPVLGKGCVQALTVIYNVDPILAVLLFHCDAGNVQKSRVPGLISFGVIELSVSCLDSFTCLETRCDVSPPCSDKTSVAASISIPSILSCNLSPSNGIEAKHNVDTNVVANNSHNQSTRCRDLGDTCRDGKFISP